MHAGAPAQGAVLPAAGVNENSAGAVVQQHVDSRRPAYHAHQYAGPV